MAGPQKKLLYYDVPWQNIILVYSQSICIYHNTFNEPKKLLTKPLNLKSLFFTRRLALFYDLSKCYFGSNP